MQFVIFILVYPILWMISMLPFPVLYLLSDAVFFLLYYIIGYRKKVVRYNLSIALPHLSHQERLRIEKIFFRHFTDSFFEMAKTMNISRKEIDERFVFTNLELYQELELKGKSIALLCAHYGSYEWLISMNHHIGFKGYGIYKRIANPYFDKLVRDIRSRFKANLIDTKSTFQVIADDKKQGVLGVYGFASDQSPRVSKAFHWADFMGINVPVHTGAEMIAKKFDMNMIYVSVKKIKRGFYEATFIPIADNPKSIPDYQITEKFLKLLENQILEKPEFYLWTHKRWKHKKEL